MHSPLVFVHFFFVFSLVVSINNLLCLIDG